MMPWSVRGALVALLLPLGLMAAERNDIPDCYQYAGLSALRPGAPQRELMVVVDETTPLILDLKKDALAHVLRFVQPGDRVSQYRISAYLPDSHMQLEFAGLVQAGPSEEQRADIGSNSLKKLDACLGKQQQFFRTQIAKHMGQSFGDIDKKIVKSEIVFSLQQIGEGWKHSKTNDKVMFLVSDMLENSDYTSFYQNNQIRQIDPVAELKKVTSAGLQADLQSVRVFVQAAGLVPNSVKNGYRSGKVMQSLQTFWHDYFAASGATLEAFGTPVMTQDLR